MKDHVKFLKTLNACHGAVEYAGRFDTLQDAWNACERGDWMLWLVGKLSGEPGSDSRKKLVGVACQCARTALQHVPAGEDRPRIAIETAEKYVQGGATLDEVRAAANAYAAADAAAYATYAAADAATYAAADAAADAAAYATYAAAAAYAAAYATYADAAAYAAARKQVISECANIIRENYSFSDLCIEVA